MIVFAEEVGEEFADIAASEGRGKVLHVGQRAVYFMTDSGTLLILGRSAIAPYSAGLGDRFQEFKERVAPARSFSLTKGILEIGDVTVVLSETCRSRKRSRIPSRVYRRDVIELARCTAVLLSGDSVDELSWGVLKNLESAVRELRRPDPDELVRSLLVFSGLGPGMTPASDDYLLGVLRALDHLGLEYSKGPVAENVRKKSTLISAKIVEHALHGCYFYVLDDLITALRDGFDAVMETLQQVLRLGKSSGLFMALGMLDAFAVYSE
jgi:hypothetical protein